MITQTSGEQDFRIELGAGVSSFQLHTQDGRALRNRRAFPVEIGAFHGYAISCSRPCFAGQSAVGFSHSADELSGTSELQA